MAKVKTNAPELAKKMRRRLSVFDRALSRGITKALVAVESKAVANVTGGGGPNAYPVRRVTGNLARSFASKKLSPTSGVVANTAAYAVAIHEGLVFSTNASGEVTMRRVERRPFLDDAVRDADPTLIVQAEIVSVL